MEITDEYNLYMILDNLNGLYELIRPWFSSKGDAEQHLCNYHVYFNGNLYKGCKERMKLTNEDAQLNFVEKEQDKIIEVSI